MERSISMLTFKGSITQAILEAKKQKKLFVVYISGEDEESTELEKSTWTDLQVADSLEKYCILLHIISGTVDAANFAAIYPQKHVPCITAIGYNGVQLWQSEGSISAEVLVSSLEKAWLSLHLKETTATVLTAALASKKSELSTSGSSAIDVCGAGSSGTVIPADSVDKDMQSSEASPLVASEMVKENDNHEAEAESTSLVKRSKEITSTLNLNPGSSIADNSSSGVEDGSLAPKNSTRVHSGAPEEASRCIKINETTEDGKAECRDNDKGDTSNNIMRVTALTEVHFNIRLPSGDCLQEKFSVRSTLSMVKEYVDRNQASDIGSYDLAIPYPRKVFGDQDLGKSLSDLGLFTRQALIVVPRQRGTSYQRGSTSGGQTSTTQPGSSTANGGGYFSIVRTMLSYINPLSYLGGRVSSSNSGQAQRSMWEYDPNPALQGNPAATGNDSRNRQRTTSRPGSNIHTLKHEEEDEQFKGKNSFWNGNSTQYGGSDDGK